MKRGELYRVERPTKRDPKGYRVYIVISRQRFIETIYDSVICAPVYTNAAGLSTEVSVGIDEGLLYESYVRCDELTSIPKLFLTNFIGSLSPQKIEELNKALKIALELE